ncbi:MAG: FG-GAP repeat protein, partial [Phycisphaerales bacterium]|nr:FG-GAP repeat protein [Phycisphaerales bacterium]
MKLVLSVLTLLAISSGVFGQTMADFFPESKRTASDGALADSFGYAVSVSGDYAVIGAYGDDDNGMNSGSAYIFERDGAGNWSEVQKLTASDGAEFDYFGNSVSISGNYAVIGADRDDDNGADSGSAYVYERDGAGNWSEVQKRTASDGAEGDRFGYAVSIVGNTVVVGAYYDTNIDNGSLSGSAYVFERDGNGNWSEVQKLTASDAAAEDYFGRSVSSSGNTMVIGADYDDDNGSASGSVYVFERDGAGNWSEVQKLTASDGAELDYFGNSVSIFGNTLAITAAYDDDNGFLSGSAYVFDRDGSGVWSETQKLTASDGAAEDQFGGSVSIFGNTLVVGAAGDDDNGLLSGSAYMFDLNSVLNLDYGNRVYGTLQAAVNEASSGDRLAVRSNAFDVGGIINLSSMPLTFIAVEPIE